MSERALKRLGLVLAVLLVLVLGRSGWQRWQRERPGGYEKKIEGWSKEAVEKIELKKGEKQLVLVKKDEGWQLNEKKADSERVQEFLTAFLPEEKVAMIAQTSSRHEQLGVKEGEAVKVCLKKGEGELCWLAGKSEPGGLYVRFVDSDPVYLLANWQTEISLDSQEWYDKTIFEAEKSVIKRLVFEKAEESFVLVKKDGEWQVEGEEKRVEKSKVDGLLTTLSVLKAKEVVEEEKEGYSEQPVLMLTVEYEGGSETLKFFKGEDDYLVERVSDGQRFLLYSTTAEELVEFES